MNDTSPSTLLDYYPRSDPAAAPRASGSNLLPVSPRRPANSLAPHSYSVLDPRSEPFMLPFTVPNYLRHASLFADRFTTGSAADPVQVGRPSTLNVAAPAATDYKGTSKQASHTGSVTAISTTGTSPAGPIRDPILLPTCWNKDDACALLELTSDALGVSFAGSAKNGDRDAAAVRANRPVPNQAGVYYFEVKILDKGVSGYIGIGLCQRSVSLSRLPGWEDKSYGYHADDGRAFCCQGTGEPFGPVFTTGDIIGCGIDWTDAGPPKGPRERTGVKSSARDRERERGGSSAADKDKAVGGGGRVFFTKNGQFIDYAFCNLQGTLYPTIGLRTPNEAVRANFGAEPFAFDIESLVLERKRAVLARLATLPPPSYTASPSQFLPSPVAASTPPIPALLPPLDRERLHETIQSLVSGYLHHHGFGETAERFEKQLKEERMERAIGLVPEAKTATAATTVGASNQATEGTTSTSKSGEAAQLASYRAEIRSNLLSGTAVGAERAFHLIESHFPAVLDAGSTASATVAVLDKAGGSDGLDVAFRLKCRVFIEAALEWSRANRDPAGMEHSSTVGERTSHSDPPSDRADEDNDTAMMSSSLLSGDIRPAPPPSTSSSSSALTLDSLLTLGQSLHAEYGSDPLPRVREELQAVLGLMAYRDPENEATGRTGELLGKGEREDLVDQVNRAVMRASGLPPVPALEALFRHATASIQLAAELGSGSAAMIDLRSQVLGR